MEIRGIVKKSVDGKRKWFIPLYVSRGVSHLDGVWPGKYYKLQGSKFEEILRVFEAANPQYAAQISYVVTLDGTMHKNFMAKGLIQVEDKTGYTIKISKTVATAPSKIKTQLEALTWIRNAWELVAVGYGSLVINGQRPYSMKISTTMENASELAKILASDGCSVSVVDIATGQEIATNHVLHVVEEEEEVAVKVDKNFFHMEKKVRDVANMLVHRYKGPSQYKGTSTVLFDGPSGYGKTSVAAVIAKALGFDLFYFDMSLVVDVEELLGTREVVNGSTGFKLNKFVAALRQGNIVIVLDELNRTFAAALNALFPLLDFRGKLIVHGEEIQVGENIVFIATRNVGSGFVGTQPTDLALQNRFMYSVSFGDLSVAEEANILMVKTGIGKAEAQDIAELAKDLRVQIPGLELSPRNTLAISQMVLDGVPMRFAWQYNFVETLKFIDERRQVEDAVNRKLNQTMDGAAKKFKVDYFA